MAEQEAIGLLEQLARDFNVRDPRKLSQIARREFPDRQDLTTARPKQPDVARQVLAPKTRSLGKSAAEGPDQRLQADLAVTDVERGGHEGPARQAGGDRRRSSRSWWRRATTS